MSAIGPASSLDALVVIERMIATQTALLSATGGQSGGDTPAVVVDLSNHAKAMLVQAQEGQAMADMLQKLVASAAP
jgi:hypothetical protein